jgi:hypothetical protein
VPELRACHDALLADPKAPALFPFGGFGLILVSGVHCDGRFFARRILSFIPTVKKRRLTIPLRRLNYVTDRAVYRASRLKLVLTFDPIVLPLGFQPDWNRWKHLITDKGFGRYSDWIDRIRARLEHTPMEKAELERLAAD